MVTIGESCAVNGATLNDVVVCARAPHQKCTRRAFNSRVASASLPKHIQLNCHATSRGPAPHVHAPNRLSITHNTTAAVMASEVNDVESSANRRRSGRVSKKPEKFAPASPTDSAKRKRGDNDDSGVEADQATSDEEESSSEGEPDEEEFRDRQRKRKGKAPAKRPAPKKPKTNGATMSLAMRPASGAPKKLAKRPRKAAIRKSAIAPDEPEGLYGICPEFIGLGLG
jgi:hypothetical protein